MEPNICMSEGKNALLKFLGQEDFFMADNLNQSGRNAVEGAGDDAVCIDVMRVYDSCGSKDCLEDMCVYFAVGDQPTIDAATSVKIKDTEIIDVNVELEPMPFHKGYFTVNITYYFNVLLEVVTQTTSASTLVKGLAVFTKQTVMYGSEGSVKMYTSAATGEETENVSVSNLPKANVQTADPISLGARLICNGYGPSCTLCQYIPESIAALYGGTFASSGEKHVLVSIGMFSMVQIVRNVQMLVHAYDYCIPCKECKTTNEDPCEMFQRIKFPTNEFFPRGNTAKRPAETDDSACN